ncbi:hypothetical protein CF319_g9012 [Tilletia indica]|nr:hypothetical protein CF319_g9012 [Tilletia indica]
MLGHGPTLPKVASRKADIELHTRLDAGRIQVPMNAEGSSIRNLIGIRLPSECRRAKHRAETNGVDERRVSSWMLATPASFSFGDSCYG